MLPNWQRSSVRLFNEYEKFRQLIGIIVWKSFSNTLVSKGQSLNIFFKSLNILFLRLLLVHDFSDDRRSRLMDEMQNNSLSLYSYLFLKLFQNLFPFFLYYESFPYSFYFCFSSLVIFFYRFLPYFLFPGRFLKWFSAFSCNFSLITFCTCSSWFVFCCIICSLNLEGKNNFCSALNHHLLNHFLHLY